MLKQLSCAGAARCHRAGLRHAEHLAAAEVGEREGVLRAQPEVDPAGIAAIGYCFAARRFSNPAADSFNNPALAYHRLTDERSLRAMRDLFDETFGPI
jgi:hypothetical protein